MLNGSEKVPSLITDYKEYHTDTTVRFVVKMTEERLREAEAAGLHKVFKLQNPLTCNSMVKTRETRRMSDPWAMLNGNLLLPSCRSCSTTWAV